MSDNYNSWWSGGDYYDRKNRAEIAEVRASESRARSRLEDQLRRQQGNFQGQLDRLTQAFVAMIEYEDIRGELNEHTDAASCRKYAREVVPNLVVTGGSGLGAVPPPPEVHDYWLSWTMQGLVSSATGGDGAEALAQAQQRDPRRTALLLVLIDAIRREPRFGIGHLDATLPRTSEVTVADRGIWLAAADGRLGDDALPALEQRLRSLLGAVDPAVVDSWVRDLVPKTNVVSPIRSAETLAALLRLVDPGGSDTPADTPALPTAWTPTSETPKTAEDPLADIVRSLVDEGAPGEAQIMARMTDVRARMGFVDESDATDHWDAAVGDLLTLVLSDLGSASTAPACRALAARLLGPALLPTIEALRAEAAGATNPDRIVHASGLAVTIGADGPVDPTWRSQLEQKVLKESPEIPLLRPAMYGALTLGVVGLALVLISPAWLFLALPVLGLGGWLFFVERRQGTTRASQMQVRLTRAHDDVERAATNHAELGRQVTAAATESQDTAARLTHVLSTSGASARHAAPVEQRASAPQVS